MIHAPRNSRRCRYRHPEATLDGFYITSVPMYTGETDMRKRRKTSGRREMKMSASGDVGEEV